MMTDNELRDSLYQSVYEEFVGPLNPDSTEVLKWTNPKMAYSAGVLYPMGSEFEEFEESDPGDPSGPTAPSPDEEAPVPKILSTSKVKTVSDEDEPIALSNAEHQSAISVSVATSPDDAITLKIAAGRYEKELKDERVVYKRVPISQTIESVPVPDPDNPRETFLVDGTHLEVMLVYRYAATSGEHVITAALRNKAQSSDPRRSSYKDCYFQVELRLGSRDGFLPIPAWSGDPDLLSEEDRSKKLIYRNIRNYAIGHGCAADWEDAQRPRWICTKIMPVSETRPVMTSIKSLDGGLFDMHSFSHVAEWAQTKEALKSLCDAYGQWIKAIGARAEELPGEFKRAATENIAKCDACLSRMRSGLALLDDDETARIAFCMANEAMLSQHLHYSVVSKESDEVHEPGLGVRMWRPFQIAFILLNIESMVDPVSPDRSILDLIWFPTGGGKTEAYLGLSAFTLILERLRGEENAGVSVIMRYTLRLLSAQQFDRAASLICALESMRRRDPSLLGKKRFSIGLWAGGAASPNTWERALNVREDLRRGLEVKEGGIPVTCCPWCGVEMGNKGVGYIPDRIGRTKTMKFVCPNKECEYGDKSNPLPLKVVDEDIYNEPPSLLLGTVDKFAMIPYRPESYSIFGINAKGEHISSPKLIIQDELHLISGPLGSMVSHYETLISELCRRDVSGKSISPKIVASTATVSKAKEQCHELFACKESDVSQFPPSGLDYDDSFFSREDKDADGRRYIGLYVPNLSYATASIRLYTQLLWTPATWELDDTEKRDPYWTVVGYYGTTRELGQAATWADSDIKERLFERYRDCDKKYSRFLKRFVELTGRIDATEVRSGLEDLKIGFPDTRAIDLCLATNMISVGLDIKRLGVMVVAGQPKETAEYIQASSRVGRGDAKGMVFVMYGTQRPRDRSHYENFKNYHESFYQHVEPSSITAFCPQVRERAMPGTLIGLYRSQHQEGKDGLNEPRDEEIELLKDIVLGRIDKIDGKEAEDASRQIESIVDHWYEYEHERWQELNVDREKMGEQIPLMHPRGTDPLECWGEAGFAVPTSMRSVDQECKVGIIGRYPYSDIEEEE